MDKKELFQIGDVAKLFHLSVGTLRHYEKSGLLQPEYIDPQSGYRYYSTRQFECLNTIRYLRVLDMPLDQIGEFLKNRDVDRIQELLEAQKEAVIRKKQELEIIERKIENRLRQLEEAVSADLDEIQLKDFPKRRIAWIRNKVSPETYLDLEMSIRQLDGQQKDAVVFLGKIGVGLAKEQLMESQFEPYDVVFLLLDPEDEYEGDVEELPVEHCLTVRFRGSHKEAAARYERLMSYAREHQLQIAGFSKEITIIDNGLTEDTDKFVTEIQIPVLPAGEEDTDAF